MSLADRSRRRAEMDLEQLADEYGDFDIYERTWERTPVEYERCVERFEADAHGGVGAWVTNERGEVLLVKNRSHDQWSDPGGDRQPGERFDAAALREVRAGTDVECELTGVSDVTVVENRDGEDADRPAVVELVVVFEATYRSGTPTARPRELSDARWWGELPEDLLYDELAERPLPDA